MQKTRDSGFFVDEDTALLIDAGAAAQ